MICSSVNRERFICPSLSSGGLYSTVEEFQGVTSSPATFYQWPSKFGGLEVSEARRLRTLEEENARLNKLLAEAMLHKAVLKVFDPRL